MATFHPTLPRGARVEASRFFGRAQALLEAEAETRPEDLIDAVTGFVPSRGEVHLGGALDEIAAAGVGNGAER